MSRNSYALTDWVRPGSYMGATWDGWKVFLGRNRDSDLLTNLNFEVALGRLQALPEGIERDFPSVYVVRESHWACGWVEWIAIHPCNAAAIALAAEMADDLNRYPVLDEDLWSERESEAADGAWRRMSVKERLRLIQEYGRSCSFLSARRDYPPCDDGVDEILREYANG